MSNLLKVSLVIIQYGPIDLLIKLLSSLEKHQDSTLISEVIIVNNGMSLNIKEFKYLLSSHYPVPIKIVNNPKTSYSSGVNCGVAASKEDFIIISNNDIEWLRGFSIQPLIECLNHPKVCISGPQLVYPDGSWQRSYGKVPSIWSALVSVMMLDAVEHILESRSFRYNKQIARRVEYIDGAFMVVDRRCFFSLGGFDEGFSFYGEDADFCYRAWHAGWNVLFEPKSRIIHVRGASSTNVALDKYTQRLLDAQVRFMQKHHGNLQAKIYKFLIRWAMLERKILYSLIAGITYCKKWRKRAEEAKERYNAIRKETLK